ncbi:DUF2071 domain-containing protein [Actinospica robiniae]|uniref:DUF2071 domain-containing protein n=1 Tax=Actinospica robiniae TaxID=304901 RepID=UPI0004285934|nr:DUF2071 domain-containing protein [Actinospica robiniae]
MSRPAIASFVERRLLVNFRLDPETTARILPAGMRPLLRRGHAVGGICLIRLAGARRSGGPLPGLADLAGRFGLRTEIAVHRIATVWQGPDGPEQGVYIPRRDTDSRISTLTAGLFLPGEHHLARFEVEESAQRLRIGFRSADGSAHAQVQALVADRWQGSSLFADLDEACAFAREAPDGFPARAEEFTIRPATLVQVASSYFEDPARFPEGSAEPDSALILRDVEALRAPRPARTAHRPARPAAHPI